MRARDVKAALAQAATACGFDGFGVCAAETLVPERERFLKWVDDGLAGDMRWIDSAWVEKASDPNHFLSGARSVICVALSYGSAPADATPNDCGRIARYANGADYHGLIREKLSCLASAVAEYGGQSRMFVDSAPTMDKALAVRAGLGWQGKNTNVLSHELGSFVFLGGLVTDLEISPDHPVNDGCGRCHACIAVCPTGALRGDYTIDARLCISYLTIEHRGSIPRELRPLIGDWVFGCDLCQDVCPPVIAIQDREFPERKAARVEFARQALGSAARRS